FLPQELVNRGRRQALRNQMACRLMHHVVAVSDELGERFCRFTAQASGPIAGLGYWGLRRRMHTISYGIDLAPYRAVTTAEVAEPMAKAFVRMAQDAPLRRTLAQSALAEAENKHSIDAVARAYQALYDNPS